MAASAFEPHPVGAGRIHALLLPTPFSIGPVNCYLIDDDPLTLVDCGPNSATALLELERQLGSLGRSTEELGLVILTHQHPDHCGLAHALAERSGAEIAALGELGPYLEHWDAATGQDAELAFETMAFHGVDQRVARAVRAVARDGRGWGAPVTVTRPLADGDAIELAEHRLQVVHAPGHSPSDLVLVEPQAGIALAGDVLLAKLTTTTTLTAPLEADWDGSRPRPLLAYRDSLRRLAAIDPALLLPGHGRPFGAVPDLVASRIREQDERAARILEAVRERPRGAYELAVDGRGEIAFNEVFNALSEVLAHLDLLLEEGEVRGEEGDGGPIFAPE